MRTTTTGIRLEGTGMTWDCGCNIHNGLGVEFLLREGIIRKCRPHHTRQYQWAPVGLCIWEGLEPYSSKRRGVQRWWISKVNSKPSQLDIVEQICNTFCADIFGSETWQMFGNRTPAPVPSRAGQGALLIHCHQRWDPRHLLQRADPSTEAAWVWLCRTSDCGGDD